MKSTKLRLLSALPKSPTSYSSDDHPSHLGLRFENQPTPNIDRIAKGPSSKLTSAPIRSAGRDISWAQPQFRIDPEQMILLQKVGYRT